MHVCYQKTLYFEGEHTPSYKGLKAVPISHHNSIETIEEIKEIVDEINLTNLALAPKQMLSIAMKDLSTKYNEK